MKALKEKINNEITKKRAIELMKKAREEYEIFTKPKTELLSTLLRYGKSERISQSYYQSKQPSEKRAGKDKAKDFLNSIVKPFIKIMKELDV